MSNKNETPVLIASLLVTAALLGGGFWWFTRDGGLNVPGLGGDTPSSTATTPSADAPASTGTQFSEVQNVPAGLFNYGGSTTWAPVRGTIDPVMQQAFPSFQLRYTDPIGTPASSGSGIDLLLKKQLSFSQSSRSLNAEEQQAAQQQGFSLKEIPVALEGLAIAVNTDLPIDGITLTQLRDIYLGNPNQLESSRRTEFAHCPHFPPERWRHRRVFCQHRFRGDAAARQYHHRKYHNRSAAASR
jgi:phosphate transport system substrate-binding protein